MTPRSADSTPEMPEWLDDLSEGEYDDAIVSAPVDRTRPIRVDDRPELRWSVELAKVTDECVEYLARDPLIYQRDHQLVTVAGTQKVDPRRGYIAIGAPIIRPMTAGALTLRVSKHVKVMALKPPTQHAIKLAASGGPKPPEEWRHIAPPPRLITSVLEANDWPSIRPLRGISETPFLRLDGTICQEAGYDHASGYIYAPSCEYPTIPEHPTQAQAEHALALLADVFREFPYSAPHGSLVPIAMILTILARPSIDGSIPVFIFEASTRGSGKSLQTHVVSEIALGRYASPVTYPDDDAELEKMLSSYAIAGTRLVVLDNVTRALGGAPIDKVLTARDNIDLRVLGVSEVRTLAWSAVVCATGNNMVISEDTQRRCLVARLESPLENPEDRTDVRDLHALCKTHRSELVAAALTILRAYCAHGRPDAGTPRWGSFEEWSSLIPPALRFAGGVDIMAARPRGEAAGSDEVLSLGVILRELPRLSPDPITSKALAGLLWPSDYQDDQPPDGWDAMREAIETLCPSRAGRRPEPKAIGERLKRATGRVVDGQCVRSRVNRSGVREWYVERSIRG
jgi:hypothetical protein